MLLPRRQGTFPPSKPQEDGTTPQAISPHYSIIQMYLKQCHTNKGRLRATKHTAFSTQESHNSNILGRRILCLGGCPMNWDV